MIPLENTSTWLCFTFACLTGWAALVMISFGSNLCRGWFRTIAEERKKEGGRDEEGRTAGIGSGPKEKDAPANFDGKEEERRRTKTRKEKRSGPKRKRPRRSATNTAWIDKDWRITSHRQTSTTPPRSIDR